MRRVDFQALDARVTGYLLDGYDTLQAHKTRPAMVICPGGAYRWCSPREEDAPVLCYPVISTWEYAHEEPAENVSAGVVAPY